MATSVLKKITAEAKLLRKKNPKIKWTTAIKKASEFYKGTVKPVAKKTYKKAKAVAKAGAKGVAVARRSYAKSMAGVELQKLPNRKKPFVFYDTKSELLWANEYFRTKSEADKFAKQNSIKYKDKTKTQVLKQLATNEYRKSKVGAVKKIAFKRTGKGGSKLGSVKKVGKPQIKPIKPTFTILYKQNPTFKQELAYRGEKHIKKLIVYSPAWNKYIVVVQYKTRYAVFMIEPSQRISAVDFFTLVGSNKATLDRINKSYDIDLIP